MQFGILARGAVAACATVLLWSHVQAAEITGAGSTFVYPILSKWAEAYKTKGDVGVSYQSIGSGGGITKIQAKEVDFGASDAPLRSEELAKHGLLQFPVVIGGVVPVVNVPGVEPGKLKLTGPMLADIYLGKITNWNDKAIAAVNPGLTLPDQAIMVVRRSDASGTTYVWVDYLAKMSPEWKEKVGVKTSVEWPVGTGGKGNAGVAAIASRVPGAIGYVEYAYVKQNKMAFVQLQNKDGYFVAPSKTSFQAAAANADWVGAKDFDLMLTDQPGKESWPVTGSTFVLMHKQPDKPDASKAVLQFFAWALKDGDAIADNLDYVAMPDKLMPTIEALWRTIKGADNKEIWAALN